MLGPELLFSLAGLFIVFAVQTVVLQATTTLYNKIVGEDSEQAVFAPEFSDGIKIVLVIAFFSMVIGFGLDLLLGEGGFFGSTISFLVNLGIVAAALRLMLPAPNWRSAGLLAVGYEVLTFVLVIALFFYGGMLGSLAGFLF